MRQFPYVFFIIVSMLFGILSFNNCSKTQFSKVQQKASKTEDSDSFVEAIQYVEEVDTTQYETDLESIQNGLEIDEEVLQQCPEQDPQLPLACLIFKDSFERENIINHENFHWETVLMDNSDNTSHVDAFIHHQDYLGPAAKGDKAILFRGRKGKKSDHEVFLVSAPFDLSGYTNAVVQYKYLPIGLEDFIHLTKSGIQTVEGSRIDFCIGSDFDCGLTDAPNRHERLRDPTNWISFYPTYASGKDNNIRDFTIDEWILHQVTLDLDQIPENRRSKVVFKISVALDEGFFNNDPEARMEDGILIDDVMLGALKENSD